MYQEKMAELNEEALMIAQGTSLLFFCGAYMQLMLLHVF